MALREKFLRRPAPLLEADSGVEVVAGHADAVEMSAHMDTDTGTDTDMNTDTDAASATQALRQAQPDGDTGAGTGTVLAVSSSATHTMSKPNRASIRLLGGLGVEGDAHMGITVKHRSRVKRDPTQPNLRQVHLLHAELLDELAQQGFTLTPGQIGENITTRGVDLLGLPRGTRLFIGADAVVEITGLRNPCAQLDGIQPGLMKATLDRDAEGNLVRKAGIMGTVYHGGEIRPGDQIRVELPEEPHVKLEMV